MNVDNTRKSSKVKPVIITSEGQHSRLRANVSTVANMTRKYERRESVKGKYITLQDLRDGYEDYDGTRNIIYFLILATLIVSTTFVGISPAAIKIKQELFEIMETRGDSTMALEARTYGEIQTVYTNIVNRLERTHVKSTVKDRSILLVSTYLVYYFQKPNSECPKTTLPPLYSKFEYANTTVKERLQECSQFEYGAVYIFRTSGLSDEKSNCSKNAILRRGKCRKESCRSSHCDNIGDWYGKLNGTSIHTATKKIKYVMDPDNNIVFPNWRMSLFLAFYHVESGYLFNMLLPYQLDDAGRYSILSSYQSNAAPLNPFYGPREIAHFILHIITTIFVIYECIKALLLIYSYIVKYMKDPDSHAIEISFEDFTFAAITCVACGFTLFSFEAYLEFVTWNSNLTLDVEAWKSCQHFARSNISASWGLVLWILVFFGKLRFHQGMSIFYNTMYRSRRELVDFAFLFFLISFVMAMCGYAIFGYGASHTHFETFSMSFFTTLGIALGHVDYEAIVGSTFGLEIAQANMFYWILLIVMFLMLNILLSIILDAFEKNQDDRRQIDKPFVQVVAINPISKMLKRLSCCKKSTMQTVESADSLGHYAHVYQEEKENAINEIEKESFSKKFLSRSDIKEKYKNERRKSINNGNPNERIENILSNITFDYNSMKNEVKKVMESENKNEEVKMEEVEKTTKLLFKAYGKDDEERAEFYDQLQEIKSHVTKSLRETEKKLADILKLLKQQVGEKLE